MNITAADKERFHILSLRHHQPYLVGEVEPYPLNLEHPEAIRRSACLLHTWVKCYERYLGVLEQTEKTPTELRQLPQDNLALAYFAANLLKISLPQKQKPNSAVE